MGAADWLRTNGWNPHHDTVILIHGYGGQEGSFPMVVLRDGKLCHTACAARNPGEFRAFLQRPRCPGSSSSDPGILGRSTVGYFISIFRILLGTRV